MNLPDFFKAFHCKCSWRLIVNIYCHQWLCFCFIPSASAVIIIRRNQIKKQNIFTNAFSLRKWIISFISFDFFFFFCCLMYISIQFEMIQKRHQQSRNCCERVNGYKSFAKCIFSMYVGQLTSFVSQFVICVM